VEANLSLGCRSSGCLPFNCPSYVPPRFLWLIAQNSRNLGNGCGSCYDVRLTSLAKEESMETCKVRFARTVIRLPNASYSQGHEIERECIQKGDLS